MKEQIIQYLKNNQLITFWFEKEHYTEVSVLINELPNDPNSIIVSKRKSSSSSIIINLSLVKYISFEEKH